MMARPIRLSQLSAPRQALVRLLQSMNFGCIEHLEVRDADPIFNPPPTVVVEVKLDSEPEPRPEHDLTDFELRAEITRLFTQMDILRDGSVLRIDVRHGIPWRAAIERPLREVRQVGGSPVLGYDVAPGAAPCL
jgi:hypothetical protein